MDDGWLTGLSNQHVDKRMDGAMLCAALAHSRYMQKKLDIIFIDKKNT